MIPMNFYKFNEFYQAKAIVDLLLDRLPKFFSHDQETWQGFRTFHAYFPIALLVIMILELVRPSLLFQVQHSSEQYLQEEPSEYLNENMVLVNLET